MKVVDRESLRRAVPAAARRPPGTAPRLPYLPGMTPTLTSREATGERREERILRAALTEFGRRGFAGAREGMIARLAGVSTATLKQHFPTKEALFREMVRSMVVRTLHQVEPDAAAGLAGESAVRRLREFARWFWQTMDEPEYAALLRLSMVELTRFPELAVFHATEVTGRAVRQLERTLADGVAQGEFRIGNTRAAARVILAALITHAHWFAHPEIFSGITGVDRAAAEESVMRVLVEGLRGR